MKKLLTIAAIAAATTALAVESSNTFGILRVTIPAGQKMTIIAAPWCDAGATTTEAQGKIKVKDIVKTANLTPATNETSDDGDKLYVFSSNSYRAAFELRSTGWTGIQMVVKGNTIQPQEEATINRGEAIALDLHTAPEEKSIYLYGQYTMVGASTTIVTCSAETPAYTLVAPTGVENDTTLNSEWLTAQTGLTPANGDQVFIPGKGFYPFAAGKGFGVTKSGTFDLGSGTWGQPTFDAATVPTGTGFWYISKGGSGTIDL